MILFFDPEKMSIRNFNHDQGLIGNETNAHSAIMENDSILWVGTMNGISRVNLKHIMTKSYMPKLDIETITIGDSIYSNHSEIETTYDKNTIQISLNGLFQYNPSSLTYLYSLTEEESWNVSNTGDFILPILVPGEYEFKFKVRTDTGEESDIKYTSLLITPPFWGNPIFILSFILILILIISYIISLKLKNRLQRERMRMKIAANLHDQIGSGLTEISILSRMLPKSDELNEITDSLIQKSTDLVDDMSDIVWLVNPKYDRVTDMLRKLGQSFNAVFEKKQIRFTVEMNHLEEDDSFDVNQKEAIYFLCKEAITNALKHSDCKEIRISVSYDSPYLELRIKDDGIGFDLDKTSYGNGIENMNQRADSVQGEIHIESHDAKGTEIVCRIKK